MGFEQMAGRTEVVVKGLKDGQKALGVTGRLEVLQCPFSSSRSLVRVFGPVIQIAALTMFGVRKQFFEGSPIAA